MSKTTKTILASLLLSSALVIPAAATAQTAGIPHRLLNFGGRFAERFAGPDRFAGTIRPRKASNSAATSKAALLDPSYTIIDEPDADPARSGTRVFSINESGQISGHYVDSNGAFHAFLGTPNGDSFNFTPITVKRSDTLAGGLNDKGAVFGGYFDKDTGVFDGWIRHPTGKIVTFAPPGGTGGTIAQSLNNYGVLTGYLLDDNGAMHGFVRDRHGAITPFDDPLGGSGAGQGTEPFTIDDKGETIGTVVDSGDVAHAFIRRSDGSFENHDVAGAGSGSGQGTLGLDIEDGGWMTGAYIDAGYAYHGFISSPDGEITTVEPAGAGTGPDQGSSVEHREAGWSVGEYVDANDVSHGFFRKSGGKIVEFDPPDAGGLGTYAVYSSNRAHRIAGTFYDENGIRHGFIRKPNR